MIHFGLIHKIHSKVDKIIVYKNSVLMWNFINQSTVLHNM